MRVFRYLFGLDAPVTRLGYLVTGAALMAAKYLIENLALHQVFGSWITPLQYLDPRFGVRFADAGRLDWVQLAVLLWSLPFIWIGVAMTMRRALDASLSGWTALLFFVPGVNWLTMLALCLLPSRGGSSEPAAEVAALVDGRMRSALVGTALSVVVALGLAAICVYGFGGYGSTLFLATPCAMAATSAFLYNRGHEQSLRDTYLVSMLSLGFAGGVLLLLAFEGALCLVMAFPLAATMGIIGTLIGRRLALGGSAGPGQLAAMVLLLPVGSGVESLRPPGPLGEVRTTIEIDALPERVWPHVIGFGELPPPTAALFRLGIAYPTGARMQGEGVGAVRHCEFSTGPFIEPITTWEPPHRLAFDVAAQPPTMHEWSPYGALVAPHLVGNLRSRRGEFRLVALASGRTRLEGSTWYELDMWPQGYWRLWSDVMIHAIHRRVLDHIASLVETDRSATLPGPAADCATIR